MIDFYVKNIEKVLYLINVERNVLCGEMWRNLSFGETYHSSHDLSCYILSLANKHYVQFMPECCEMTLVCCKQCCFVAQSVLSQFTLFFCEICFVSIYALFVWRKIELKIVVVEKKRQISGMVVRLQSVQKNDVVHCDLMTM